ncbi:MAG: hypothetical protein ACK4V2_07425 [Pseudomonadota bacterium]|nr:hypothetical protein [Alphaproteobacteria bacterium]
MKKFGYFIFFFVCIAFLKVEAMDLYFLEDVDSSTVRFPIPVSERFETYKKVSSTHNVAICGVNMVEYIFQDTFKENNLFFLFRLYSAIVYTAACADNYRDLKKLRWDEQQERIQMEKMIIHQAQQAMIFTIDGIFHLLVNNSDILSKEINLGIRSLIAVGFLFQAFNNTLLFN